MTQAEPTVDGAGVQPHQEKFFAVTLRRARYTAAIVVSGLLFWTVGWQTAGPAAPHHALTLLGWGASPVAAALALGALLILATIASMVITHPDTPHAGLFCALLGMGALAIRGGTIFPLLRSVDNGISVEPAYRMMAIECVFWAAILFVTELVAGKFHAAFFANTDWMSRVAGDPEAFRRKWLSAPGHGGSGLGSLGHLASAVSKAQADKLKKDEVKPMNIVVANGLALALGCVVALILLPAFMQSQNKGQVLFAAFVVFGAAGFLANLAFGQSSAWPVILCVPLAAAIGYWRAKGMLDFPGFSASAAARALPVDYMAAGVPGALFGYYASVRLRLSHLLEMDQEAQ